jgi:hypothetical protein
MHISFNPIKYCLKKLHYPFFNTGAVLNIIQRFFEDNAMMYPQLIFIGMRPNYYL